MGKNDNGDCFVNRCIRLGGSVVVTAATGNKIDIAQFPSTNGNNNSKQAPLIKSKYVAEQNLCFLWIYLQHMLVKVGSSLVWIAPYMHL